MSELIAQYIHEIHILCSPCPVNHLWLSIPSWEVTSTFAAAQGAGEIQHSFPPSSSARGFLVGYMVTQKTDRVSSLS